MADIELTDLPAGTDVSVSVGAGVSVAIGVGDSVATVVGVSFSSATGVAAGESCAAIGWAIDVITSINEKTAVQIDLVVDRIIPPAVDL